MKILQIILITLISVTAYPQQSFFETIKSHGEDAVYQRYYSVYKDDDGNQKIEGKQYQLKVELLKLEDVFSGVKLVGASKNDKAGIATFDATLSKSVDLVGYPNVSHVLNKSTRKAYVAIGDYIFKLGNVWKEGLGFNDINAIYIRVGASGKETGEGNKKKKKKFGSFMNKLKDAAVNKAPSECTSPACKKAQSMNLNTFVREYLEKMKLKQDKYTLTAKDKLDITLIKNAVNGYYKKVDKKNDAFWKSEEGQVILRNRRNAEAFDAVNTVKIKNNTGKVIYIGDSNQAKTIYDGSTGDWDCKRDGYLMYKIDSSNYSKGKKIYSANTNCGGTKTID